MRNYKNNHRRNRFRKNGSKQNHQKDNGHKTISDFTNNFNYRPRNQWKNNQNASKLIEKYNNLAREALSNGDKILSESYFQHADHFVRILGEKEIIKDNPNNKVEEVKEEEVKEQNSLDN
tara:strand:- start:460 stop:819 length:360 start_codon:yes stop_codon:yes gene_type:complete